MAKLDDRVNVEMDPKDALRLLLDEKRREKQQSDDEDDAGEDVIPRPQDD